MPLRPLSTQIVGSYAKPPWLARHQRMRAMDGSWWRPAADVLQDAKQDAARLAIYEQERAGLDIVTDGEAQRAAYDRAFLTGLSGIDMGASARAQPAPRTPDALRRDETGWEEYSELSRRLPIVSGAVRFLRSAARDEVAFAKRVARRPLKATVIGPLSLSNQVADQFYRDQAALIMNLAAALNEEMRSLEVAGADLLQIDEPGWHSHCALAHETGRQAITRMVAGVSVPVIVHVCYGYAIVYKKKTASGDYPRVLELLSDCPIAGISLEYEQPRHDPGLLVHCGDKHVVLGLLDLARREVETPAHIADRLRAALAAVPAERLHASSDCGMWHLPRELALGKIMALAEGAALMRRELGIARDVSFG
jgi:5-methyltetrahydropteroyltriglutamate--homocysteine methyltransferase